MPKTASGKMRVRIRIVLSFFLLLGFSVILGRLVLVQLIDGEYYQQLALEQQTRATELGARRGTIYDRNWNPLAKSATVWNVCISPVDLDKDTLDTVASDLAEILDITKQEVLDQAAYTSAYYRRIKRRVERSTMEAVLEYITEKGVDGVFFEPDTKRYYTYGTLASSIVGFTNDDGKGAYGLEAWYDKTLSGTSGIVVSAKNAKGSNLPFEFKQQFPAQDGRSVVLTIDEAIQHYLEKNLETAVVEHNISERAAGIVMNVKTGEILAMASKPDYDPNDAYTLNVHMQAELDTYMEELADDHEFVTASRLKWQDEGNDITDWAIRKTPEYQERRKNLWYEQWRNKAISDPYEPGSVFKIITAATALDNRVVGLNDHFYCDGSIVVSDRTIGCWQEYGHGDQDFTKAMQNSCNPAFVLIGQRIGGRLFYNYFDAFGFGKPTGIDLPGEAEGLLHTLEQLNRPGMSELASASFGQTFKVTSLQLITATSAAVNGGNLMQPYIVKQVVDADGNVIETTQPTVKRQVISEETSAVVRDLVEAVVKDGSGRNSAIPGYRIGGKTGTSQKIDINPDLHILSFVGFAPMEDPQIAVLVMLDEPELENAFGSTIAAPVVGAILQEALPYLNIDPHYTAEELEQREVEVPYLIGQKPHDAQSKLTGLGLKTRMVGSGATVLRQIPQAGEKTPKAGTVILYTEDEAIKDNIEVPDVVGMSAQDANKAILGAGLNIKVQGVTTDGVPTRVREQWPLPGTQAKTGDIVTVTLEERPEEDLEIPVDRILELPLPVIDGESG